MLQLRLTTQTDYTELCNWWGWWPGWSKPPTLEALDYLKYGIMISNGEQNICAGFIYFTNAKTFGLIEYIISTPYVKNREIRKEALQLLIASLINIASKEGIQHIFSSVRNESLIKHYEACGFQKGNTNTTEMIINIESVR